MYQSGRAGDEAKKRKSPAKSGRVGITDCCEWERKAETLVSNNSHPPQPPVQNLSHDYKIAKIYGTLKNKTEAIIIKLKNTSLRCTAFCYNKRMMVKNLYTRFKI